jgi:hypothetical protein
MKLNDPFAPSLLGLSVSGTFTVLLDLAKQAFGRFLDALRHLRFFT